MAKKVVKKKKTRFGFLKNTINLSSRKGKLIATFLIFAVIGGGIFVYQTFAATESWTYTADNGLLRTTEVTPDCSAVKVKEPSKNNATVFNLSCPRYNGGNATVSTVGAAGAYNNRYRACAMIKGAGRVSLYLSGTTRDGYHRPGTTYNPYGTMYNDIESVKNNGNYNYYCTNYITISAPGVSSMIAGVSANRKNSFVNVSNVTIEHIY